MNKSGLNITSTSFTSNPPTKQLEWNDSAYLFIHSLDVCFAGLWWTVALFTNVSSLNCRRRTYSFHAARKARSVRRVLPPRSPRCRSDCRHHSSLSKLRKEDSCAWEFGEQKKKRTRRPWKNCKGNEFCSKKHRNKIRLILHRILQLFCTLVKVLA